MSTAILKKVLQIWNLLYQYTGIGCMISIDIGKQYMKTVDSLSTENIAQWLAYMLPDSAVPGLNHGSWGRFFKQKSSGIAKTGH